MVSDRIKQLRTDYNLTQAELARKLSLTRNAVNSWEQGFSLPSLACLVELAKFFNVSADYILELNSNANICTDGLNSDEIALITALIDKIKGKNPP